jgi:hypothetical protein
MSKYSPFEEFLRSLPSGISTRSVTFKEIEGIIGASLPKSARIHSAWWSNQTNVEKRPHARAWSAAGFEVAEIRLMAEQVKFCRKIC